ncbi:hypothetical protein E1B28_006817 [Marasmius oreades]|uniref:Myb/SANT-like domain-containing protein n=1 Tax=Marasmius oreades TaxID=181124 RepID=A0A9P7UWX9_9AGAR|nr:uncharacterized protein E1B28_006817 [Marasmius oreades]KAG7096144.1 hypothetical protein E1B28_006817 [Marasmius oreades]
MAGVKAQRAVWTPTDDEILIQGLVQAKTQGHGKKPVVGPQKSGHPFWRSWPRQMVERDQQNQSKWQMIIGIIKRSNLCAAFQGLGGMMQKSCQLLRMKFGISWRKVQREYDSKGEKKKNKYLRWRTTPFPLYDDILYIVTRKRATREGHFVGGGDNTQSSFVGGGDNTQSTIPDGSRAASVPLTQSWSPSPPCTIAHEDEDPFNTSQEISHLLRLSNESPTPKRGGKRRADATFELAKAMNNIASAMTSDSPLAKRQAMRMLNEDGFEDDVLPLVQRLITRDSDVARIYCATSPTAARVRYAKNMLL